MDAANLTGIPPITRTLEPSCRTPAVPESVQVARAAILFADIVGFTCMTEDWSPAESIDFLRNYQQRMATQVIQHNGNVIQYQGDAIVATFGGFHETRCAAGDALSCAFTMLDAIAAWNADRNDRGELTFSIGIGIHFGTVGMGQIGVEQHLEQAIAGDTVNVARKLEALTRKLGASIVVSDELFGAIRREIYPGWRIARLKPYGRFQLAGRANSVSIRALSREQHTV
jgi:adenylate cyclase